MNRRHLIVFLLSLPILTLSGLARALDIQAYAATSLDQARAAGKPVVIHFHADWCPTCKAQAQAFKRLQEDPELKGITLFVARYDDERDLKKAMNVRTQSVIVVMNGSKETARLGGETQLDKIKAALLTAL